VPALLLVEFGVQLGKLEEAATQLRYTVGRQFELHEGKSSNNRNFILKCMEKNAQRKILFRDTKWLLSNVPYGGRDDRAV
jgi:hypothetical protein